MKKGGDGISSIEKKERAELKKHERDEDKHDADIVAAINAIADQLKTNDREQNAADDKRAFREKVTIGLVFLTFATALYGDKIFYCTMMDNRKANRPVISFSGPPSNVPDANAANSQIVWKPIAVKMAGNGRVFWGWWFKNTGHGLALNVRQSAQLEIVGKFPVTAEYGKESSPVTISPEDTQNATTISLEEMNEADFNKLLATNRAITLRVTFTYDDVFGQSYTTPLCASRLATGAIMNCEGEITPTH
ncbi:MAG TPA: hypothetical protein VG819_04325 [Rhizomicrobium sp.]|jgi:hypothetical protein|nr:hypothetical protein [Rhizomicrobium sp.]